MCHEKFQFLLNENEVENVVKNTSKLEKILNENERILFVHFREFRSTKISMETLMKSYPKYALVS